MRVGCLSVFCLSGALRHGRRKTGTSRPWPNAGRSTAFMKYIVTSIYNMNCELDRKTGLGPLLCNGPKVLILGSLPGDRSLELQEYYGHPQNRFWKVIAAIHGLHCPADYAGKKAMLARCRIALWDIYHAASRPGSMDSDIRAGEFNDIAGLLHRFPSIRTIALNGSAAAGGFDKYLSMSADCSSAATGRSRAEDAIATAADCKFAATDLVATACKSAEIGPERNICGSPVRILRLPSTSPANARWTPARLEEAWSELLREPEP